jgi:hypothetical protein
MLASRRSLTYKARRPVPHPSSKDEVRLGLAQGRVLFQFEFSNRFEVIWIEELIHDGEAIATEWYKDPRGQWKRIIQGVKHALPNIRELIKD